MLTLLNHINYHRLKYLSYDISFNYSILFNFNALFKELVDIRKYAIMILTVSTVKINRHWQFNDISAYKCYLFHHGLHICIRFQLSHIQCIYHLLFEYSPVKISLQTACVDLISESFLFQDSKFQTALDYVHQP